MWECLDQVNVSTRAKNSIAGFKQIVQQFAERAKKGNAYDVASFVAKQSGLLTLMKQDTTIEGMGRLENLNALLDGIKDFVENDEVIEGNEISDKSLAAYLQNIALLTDLDNNETGDYVTLMSVHSAKGLEFKAVFVVGLEEKLFPSFMSMDTIEGLDEERRLFYVAITRAELFLTLSYANSRYRYGKMQYNEPSRFLEEISHEHLESTFSIRTRSREAVSSGAKVVGNFKPLRKTATMGLKVDPNTFKPSASEEIQPGMKVLHMKFGEGKVLSIDGNAANRIATIFFKGIDNPQRRLVLKFAKLQIL